jgi:hypothetical protein
LQEATDRTDPWSHDKHGMPPLIASAGFLKVSVLSPLAMRGRGMQDGSREFGRHGQ